MDEKPKRGAPRPVTPLEINGVRYEALRGAKARGFKQDGGVMVAIDMTTGQELWTLLVYQTAYDEKEERDVQESYITKLNNGPEASSLRVENEAREAYLVNLKTREVSEITGQ